MNSGRLRPAQNSSALHALRAGFSLLIAGNIIPPNLASALTRSLTSYDAMGRVVGYMEFNQSGVSQHERYAIVHDLRGQVIAEKGDESMADFF